jgi:TolB protein
MERVFLAVIISLWVGVFASADEDVVIELPGTIAYIGSDYNVYSYNLHVGGINALTDDASSSRHYQWPTWSNGNQLAYFCCDPTFSGVPEVEIFVSDDGMTSGETIYRNLGQIFTYAAWSPSECDSDDTCRDLGVLLSNLDVGRFSVDVFRSSGETEPEIRSPGLGSPFYFSWSPDGRQMLLQRNGRRLELFDLISENVERLTPIPGAFQAPEWSPIDDRLLFGVRNAVGATDLVVVANSEQLVLEPDIPGLVLFNWSPDGNYVAFRTYAGENLSPLYVVDTVTGKLVAETIVEGVVAFFWSPDSSKIAFLTFSTAEGSFSASAQVMPVSLPAQQTDGLVWSVLDVSTGETRRYSTFLPTRDMLYLLTYFDQFNQSHQLWSPDSTHIVFSELSPDGEPKISILDMSRPDTVPFSIADGVIGIWSYR